MKNATVDVNALLSSDEKLKSITIRHMLAANQNVIWSFVSKYGGSNVDLNTIMNDGIITLIHNLKNAKFQYRCSLNTYYVGICKILWLNKCKPIKNCIEVFIDDLSQKEYNVYVDIVDYFEKADDFAKKWEKISNQLPETCVKILRLWSLGYSMTEICKIMEYKNSQVAMNKKSKCLKALFDKKLSDSTPKKRLKL
ncbi:MAG: hypothetical protein H6607_12420 [Flavobacteriales bacterium]|nr:hypothetical protein [Flavobacteriales bacterium]